MLAMRGPGALGRILLQDTVDCLKVSDVNAGGAIGLDLLELLQQVLAQLQGGAVASQSVCMKVKGCAV